MTRSSCGWAQRLLTCAILALLLAGISAVPARATLAPTPYMGWNTYYGVGGIYNEQTIVSVASSLVSRGLSQAGYRIVWLDFGWASGARDSQGNLVVDSTQWPHGLAWLTAYLHQQGLLAGIYTDAGASGCNGQGVGSLGHYQQDVDAFAAWGFDAIKVDFCGAGQAGLSPQSQYAQFAQAVANNASHRPMLLNVCNFWEPGQIDGTAPTWANSAYANYEWAPQIAQSWRTDTDIGFGGGRGINFADVLRNLESDAAHPEAAGPGHWNDPDYLGPELGMTSAQAQAQFSMWAMLAAPLVLGSDPRQLSLSTIAMLTNQRVIAVDQDPAGVQGTLLSRSGSGDVWVKPLAGGDRAVALLNRGTTALEISTTAAAVGVSSAGQYALQDLWTGEESTTTGPISALVPPQSAVLYRVSPLGGEVAISAPSSVAPSHVTLPEPSVVAVAGAGGHMYVQAPQLPAGWQDLGGYILAAPAVAAQPRTTSETYGQPLFVAVGGDHALWVRGLIGGWTRLARSYCRDNPAAVISGSTLFVGCEGADHALWVGAARLSTAGLPYVTKLRSLGGRLSAGPAIAPVGRRLVFFVSGSNRQLYTRALSGRYVRHGLWCLGHPAAGRAPGAGTTYVACDDGHALWVSTNAGHGWSAKTRYGGSITNGPAVAVASGAGPVFYAEAPDRSLWTASAPNRWSAAAVYGVEYGAGAAAAR